MLSKKDLVELGYTEEQAEKLLKKPEFQKRFQNKTKDDFSKLIDRIVRAYLPVEEFKKANPAKKREIVQEMRKKATKAILTTPSFAGYNHERVMRDVMRIYEVDRKKVTKAIFGFPSFAGYNHERVIGDVMRVYGVDRKRATKAILTTPSFAGYNYERVMRDVMRIYEIDRKRATKAILANPPFVRRDHERVIEEVMRVYGVDRKRATKAILANPPFAGRNHEKVLRRSLRLGKLIGLKKEEVISAIFEKPLLTNYSSARNLAAIDASRNAVQRTGAQISNKELFEKYIKYYDKFSPYPQQGSKKGETFWARKGRPGVSVMGEKIGAHLRKRTRK